MGPVRSWPSPPAPNGSGATLARSGLVINPYPLAMVLCDAIWMDPATGKRTLLGCFSAIGSRRFPTEHLTMAVYIALTGGRGVATVKLQFADAAESRPPILMAEAEVEFRDPRAVVEMGFPVRALEVPEPGEYAFQVCAEDELLVERRISVVRIAGGPTDEEA